ncbi:MAG TPA: sensor histidine kinase [Burkholderiales bacterium]|nr:sensor histidine kinase [Burkholderiales bacterium]
MPSIRQNAHSDVLPDFRNLGVIARVLLAANIAAIAAALLVARDLAQGAAHFVQSASVLEPLLLACVLALAAASPLLGRLVYWQGCAAVLAIVLALTAAAQAAIGALPGTQPDLARMLALSGLATAVLLVYFRLLAKAYSPALTEARLQALQARIRPHFLFNSLNMVLSLVRRDPRRAERALEDLSDLFRTLMSEPRQFVRLAEEIELLQRYAELEQLRLGERLQIDWELDTAPLDALLPPLVLQPLLENAVHHGVEPGTGPGVVLVRIERRGDRVFARIENPYIEEQQRRAGNRMALDNIRERLLLFFDAEARIRTSAADSRYRVEIEMPYRIAARTETA